MRLLTLTTLALVMLPLACGESSSNLSSGSGGATAPSVGGNTGTQPSGGNTSSSDSTSTGTSPAVGGSTGDTSATSTEVVGPGTYALPAPSECSNQFSVQGCKKGEASSACGGKCANDYGPTAKNACESGKEGVPVQYACPRHMLFSPEMEQAVSDDGYAGKFNYAIVGHDPDPSNLDKGLPNSCCQCYQLVYDKPTYLTASTLTPPIPLIVQSANTAASGPLGFDVFMGAGGLGAFNACGAVPNMGLSQGNALYSTYAGIGQPGSGGVKPGPDSVDCADNNNNLTDALIAAESCQSKITAACNEITATSAMVQDTTRNSCVKSNQASSYYHENWDVYAKRVACPEHLTEVTGCKPDQAGVPAAMPEVQTVAQATAAGFSSGYHTTTMQDCCMPTCAWSNNVQVTVKDGYNSFYSCLADGSPVTK